jgi:hypothetical protein
MERSTAEGGRVTQRPAQGLERALRDRGAGRRPVVSNAEAYGSEIWS